MRACILIVAMAAAFASLVLWLPGHENLTLGERKMNYGISIMTEKLGYAPGEPVTMMLKVFNRTGEEVTFHFNTAQRYDFVIKDEEENEVWRWSKDRMFATVLGEETLGPDNPEAIYTAQYKGKLSPGSYKITGILVAVNRPMAGSITITVK